MSDPTADTTSGTEPERPSRLDHVADWLDRRGISSTRSSHAIRAGLSAERLRVPIRLEVRQNGGEQPALLFRATGEATYEKEHWGNLAAACNQWNRGAFLPTARLATADDVAALVLESWTPLVGDLPAEVIDVHLELLLRSSVAFWRTREQNDPTDED
ncbi:MAG: YbjN domain-containing protein [Acidimicrobiales bacterium]|nr:YbjN domain-containing protein [Acidimicrobiales bacterium]